MADVLGGQPTPDPGSVLGSGAPAPPATASLPVSANQAPPAPQAKIQAPALPDKHQMLGRLVSHIKNSVEGTQTSYVPERTPNGSLTGQVKEVQVPRKPGGLFRDMLSGMLSGMAAGSVAGDHPSGAAGLGLGFMGAQQNRQQADSKAKNRAVERAGAQKSAQDQDAQQQNQEMATKGAVAQSTLSSLDFGHHVGLHSDDDVDSHNRSVEVVKQAALDNGGTLASIDNNGKPGNGPALMEAYNKDPQSVMQAPEGYHRIPSISYDTTGLKHEKGQWANKDGSPLDEDEWNKRATVSLIDLPNSAWGKKVVLTKKDANDVAGRTVADGKPTDSVSTDFGSLFGLGLKNLSQMNADRRALNAPIKNDSDYKGQKAKLDALRDKPTEELSDDERNFVEKRGPIIDKYKPKDAAPTAVGVKLDTERMEKDLAAGKLSDQDRATLVQRQKADPNRSKGVPADIVAAIGEKPVAAEYPLGSKDPQYKADSKAWGDASINKKTALQASSGLARYQMLGRIRAYNVVDTESGQMSEMNANQLADASEKSPGKFVLATQDGTKTMGKQAAIKDIQFNLDNTKQKIDALDDMDAVTRAKLSTALRDTDPHSAVSTFLQSEAGQALNEKQQDAVIALNSMTENIMLLRAVQGVGGAGSDMMRSALINLVPSGKTPNKGYAAKQLSTVQRTLDQLKTGVPTVGKQSDKPVQPGDNKPKTISPPAQGFTRIKASDGTMHDIPSANLGAAKKIDPKLSVVGQ